MTASSRALRIAGVCVVAGAAAWFLRGHDDPVSQPSGESPATSQQATAAGPAATPKSTSAKQERDKESHEFTEQTPDSNAILLQIFADSPVDELIRAREQLQGFIGDSASYTQPERVAIANDLLALVDRLDTNGYVTGPEALTLRLALLKSSLSQDEFQARSAEIIEQAKLETEAAEREFAQRVDPRLERYRMEQRRIVEATADMDSFPGGLTRQAYLQQRLTELRSEIYSE